MVWLPGTSVGSVSQTEDNKKKFTVGSRPPPSFCVCSLKRKREREKKKFRWTVVYIYTLLYVQVPPIKGGDYIYIVCAACAVVCLCN